MPRIASSALHRENLNLKKRKKNSTLDAKQRRSSISYVRRIFRKTNISYPLMRTHMCTHEGGEMLVFRKILRTY